MKVLFDPDALSLLPPSVVARKHVPQVALLSRADVFVTHAGANSPRVRDALARVTTDPSYRDAAERMGAHLRAAGGVPRAAEVLERIADAAR